MKTTYKTIKINSAWIKENTNPIDWQRKIYKSRLNTFINHIKNGTFREHSLIVLWKDANNEKYKVLDGQHKLLAIMETETSQLLDIRFDEDIDEKEAMAEYDSMADVKHHRMIDVIKKYVYGEKNKWLIAFLDEKTFPINVSLNGGVNSMRIDSLLNVMSNGFRTSISRANLSKKKLPLFIASLDEEIYSKTKEFCDMYKECFGDPSTESWVYKNIVMFTVMRIWLANKDFMNRQEMIESFKRIESRANIRQNSLVTSAGYLEIMTKDIYKAINYERSVNKFIIFWDENMKPIEY